MRWHPRFKKWLPPGGHVEPYELPYKAALREAKEETGLAIELIDLNPFNVAEPNAKSVPRPYLCLLESVDHPPIGSHQHMDFIFIGIAKDLSKLTPESEEARLKWFTLEETNMLCESVIFRDVKMALNELLNPLLVSPLFDNEEPAPIG
jgi:8-oxo-dGTP pyrophosphatase MutT (NUDIX family)